MMRSFPLLLGLVALPALAQEAPTHRPPEAAARPAGAVGVLLQQGQRWLDQGRPDLAALSVQRALAAEPQNADVLLLGVRVEAARNSRDAAATYAGRLRSASASPAQLATAESEYAPPASILPLSSRRAASPAKAARTTLPGPTVTRSAAVSRRRQYAREYLRDLGRHDQRARPGPTRTKPARGPARRR